MSALMVLGRLHSWITFHLSSLLDRVSAACPFNRAGHLRSQQLIGLRKAAYQSLRCAFRASRIATCIMLKSYPPQAASAVFFIIIIVCLHNYRNFFWHNSFLK